MAVGNLTVHTNIGGSHVVVSRTEDHYIDARKWGGDFTEIEVVRNGHVYRRESTPNKRAPETIIRLMREELH